METMQIMWNHTAYQLELTQNGQTEWIVKYEHQMIATFYRSPYSWGMVMKRKCPLRQVLMLALQELNARDFEEEELELKNGTERTKVVVRTISDNEYILILPTGRELLIFYKGARWRVRGAGSREYAPLTDLFIHYLKKLGLPHSGAGDSSKVG